LDEQLGTELMFLIMQKERQATALMTFHVAERRLEVPVQRPLQLV